MREDFAEFAVYHSSVGRRSVARFFDMLIDISFEIEFLLKCTVYRRKWLEGHVAPPPKSQFRGQGIYTAISLRDLRDASLENTSGQSLQFAQFKLYPS